MSWWTPRTPLAQPALRPLRPDLARVVLIWAGAGLLAAFAWLLARRGESRAPAAPAA